MDYLNLCNEQKKRGQWAEDLACTYLLEQGLQLVKRNFLCKMGEIDLIMQEGNILVFIEVRYRRVAKFGHALESVTWHKQKKLMRAAEYFLVINKPYRSFKCRLDVVSIMPNVKISTPSTMNTKFDIVWVKDAFGR